ncbi:MAG TPA: phosphocholine cytidylyltransferase family protein [Candidatus Nanoarchaeia archaeon]
MIKTSNPDENISVVILAAGFGMRLRNNKPKALVGIADNKTILDYQVENLSKHVGIDNIIVVVGYKKEFVMEQHPELNFVYNESYVQTNTGKSLLKALKKIKNSSVLWLNGDVVFDERIIPELINKAKTTKASCVLVDNKRCGEEEVKYNLDNGGYISSISKEVKNPKGEALGINLVIEKDLPPLIKNLNLINDQDYFEKAIANAIYKEGIKFLPVNTGGLFCSEVDFPEDLAAVKKYLSILSKEIVLT